MSDEALNAFAREARRYPLLTAEQERELAAASLAGDLEARAKLVRQNLRLLLYWARRYARRWPNFDPMDLIQAGYFGLARAAETYDARVRFSTYATRGIRHYIWRYRENLGRTVRIPVWRQHAKDADPLPREISLATPLGEGTTPLVDMLADSARPVDEVLIERDMEAEVEAIFASFAATLVPRERTLFKLRFVDNLTLEATGESLGVCRERVRQVEVEIRERFQRFLLHRAEDAA